MRAAHGGDEKDGGGDATSCVKEEGWEAGHGGVAVGGGGGGTVRRREAKEEADPLPRVVVVATNDLHRLEEVREDGNVVAVPVGWEDDVDNKMEAVDGRELAVEGVNDHVVGVAAGPSCHPWKEHKTRRGARADMPQRFHLTQQPISKELNGVVDPMTLVQIAVAAVVR